MTSFFRDPEAFDALERIVLPKLFEGRGANDTVRVWVLGCSTGEEVYSIAILMRAYMLTLQGVPKVQIFATDIDEGSLVIARAARYPAPLVGRIDDHGFGRFFEGRARPLHLLGAQPDQGSAVGGAQILEWGARLDGSCSFDASSSSLVDCSSSLRA